MNSKSLLVALLATAVALTACRPVGEAVGSATHTVVTGHDGGAYTAKNTDRYNVEQTSKVALMDYRVQRSVTYNSLLEHPLEDGRLEVGINLRNRLSRRIQVQTQCVFKDISGFGVDETPWQSVVLTENSQETLRFTSMNNQAKGYTIRVREAR